MDFNHQPSKEKISMSADFLTPSEALSETDTSTGSSEESMKLLFSYYINFEPDFQTLLSKELDLITESPK